MFQCENFCFIFSLAGESSVSSVLKTCNVYHTLRYLIFTEQFDWDNQVLCREFSSPDLGTSLGDEPDIYWERL